MAGVDLDIHVFVRKRRAVSYSAVHERPHRVVIPARLVHYSSSTITGFRDLATHQGMRHLARPQMVPLGRGPERISRPSMNSWK